MFGVPFSSRWRAVRQAQEEGRQVDHRRVQHRLLGPERVCRPLRAAAVPAAEDLPDAAATTTRGTFSKMGHSWHLFLYFRLLFLNVQVVDKILPMLGFEPRIFSVGSDRSTN